MKAQVGKIINDEICLLDLKLILDISKEKFRTDIEYAPELINDQRRLMEETNKYLKKIKAMMFEDLNEIETE